MFARESKGHWITTHLTRSSYRYAIFIWLHDWLYPFLASDKINPEVRARPERDGGYERKHSNTAHEVLRVVAALALGARSIDRRYVRQA